MAHLEFVTLGVTLSTRHTPGRKRTVGTLFRLTQLTIRALLFGLIATSIVAADKDVIINEIMYHPPAGQDQLQYVELFNRGPAEVNLSKWEFNKGIKFQFPNGSKIGPGAYLVVCSNRTVFAAHYGSNIPALGPFSGRLSHKGKRLDLCNAQKQLIESVKYSDGRDWPRGADGYSSSLERICPFADGDDPANWAASPWPATKRAAGSPGRQNDSFSTNRPPAISKVEFWPKAPGPQQRVTVRAQVDDLDGLKEVTLLYRLAGSARESEQKAVAMTRSSGDDRSGVYEGYIDGQPQGQLVRFRIHATGHGDSERLQPAEFEPRPAYSYFCYTNTVKAPIPIGQLVNVGKIVRGPGHYQQKPARRPANAPSIRGSGAFLYVPAEGGEPETYDYVRIVTRHGGYKVHFQKDVPLKQMTGINLISEGSMRWVLAEPLSYTLYRMAGVPAPLSEHVRLFLDGRPLGFHLLVEQPNKGFLARNGRDDTGNLYKLIWYGHGLIGQHEKKTHPAAGHADIIQLIEGLRQKSGADQWAFIQQQFNVDEVVNYYAVNMCIQNWDGFFNNYFTYHDTGGAGKWEIYPWDEDKTWGDYDGASPRYDWYEMPLTFGMNGDNSPRNFRSTFGGGGPFGGVSWWRPPGFFSGPLLANREFRKQFLTRLGEICSTVFTEENFNPIINTMEQRLQPDVRLRAQVLRQDPEQSVREFTGYMQSFRAQVQNRRRFILSELDKIR